MAKTEESVVHGSTARPEDLPSVDKLLRTEAARALVITHGHTLVAGEARAMLDELRARTLAKSATDSHLPSRLCLPTLCEVDVGVLGGALAARVGGRLQPRMRAVFNLTGTVIHTNLGRSVLADSALQHLLGVLAFPNNLEYDLDSGGRGDRDSHVEDLLCAITGCEAATVVNNNAAAVLLTIAALARDREVIVSRGELVEIGGAFRMPDVMSSAGAHMVEVGTTNRTHPADYEQAINERTALIMKVHTSNYEVRGFTAAVDEATLSVIAHARGVPLATDLGSGSLVDLAAFGLPREPLPQEMLKAGCDVVAFSGDKLLGGPQAGLIVGSRAAVGRIRTFPMKRALRVSKLPLAALEATLLLYLQPEKLAAELPTLRMLTRPAAQIEALASRLLRSVTDAVAPRFTVCVAPMKSQIGSGSLPVDTLASFGLAFAPAGTSKKGVGTALELLSSALRRLPMPVIGRIADDRLLLDLRCLEDESAFVGLLKPLREALA